MGAAAADSRSNPFQSSQPVLCRVCNGLGRGLPTTLAVWSHCGLCREHRGRPIGGTRVTLGLAAPSCNLSRSTPFLQQHSPGVGGGV
jgi:hypothetical protein